MEDIDVASAHLENENLWESEGNLCGRNEVGIDGKREVGGYDAFGKQSEPSVTS